ncbi:unnamed protein product [Protopolystoma xenopodis]|uniref:Uncharacterized protein n=1 Tax=Protopolystoma xenopodis TaxID=117903 RepID=A0A3S5AC53_9PLAT|nr:unnamed protein product [Protopolystoma xenopodis]
MYRFSAKVAHADGPLREASPARQKQRQLARNGNTVASWPQPDLSPNDVPEDCGESKYMQIEKMNKLQVYLTNLQARNDRESDMTNGAVGSQRQKLSPPSTSSSASSLSSLRSIEEYAFPATVDMFQNGIIVRQLRKEGCAVAQAGKNVAAGFCTSGSLFRENPLRQPFRSASYSASTAVESAEDGTAKCGSVPSAKYVAHKIVEDMLGYYLVKGDMKRMERIGLRRMECEDDAPNSKSTEPDQERGMKAIVKRTSQHSEGSKSNDSTHASSKGSFKSDPVYYESDSKLDVLLPTPSYIGSSIVTKSKSQSFRNLIITLDLPVDEWLEAAALGEKASLPPDHNKGKDSRLTRRKELTNERNKEMVVSSTSRFDACTQTKLRYFVKYDEEKQFGKHFFADDELNRHLYIMLSDEKTQNDTQIEVTDQNSGLSLESRLRIRRRFSHVKQTAQAPISGTAVTDRLLDETRLARANWRRLTRILADFGRSSGFLVHSGHNAEIL